MKDLELYLGVALIVLGIALGVALGDAPIRKDLRVRVWIEPEAWTNNYEAVSKACLLLQTNRLDAYITNHQDRLDRAMEGWYLADHDGDMWKLYEVHITENKSGIERPSPERRQALRQIMKAIKNNEIDIEVDEP